MAALLGVLMLVLVAGIPALLDDQVTGIPEPRISPPGTPALTDRQAASRVVRTGWEMRRENVAANRRRPTRQELAAFASVSQSPYADRVTGAFTGTTQDILRWGAAKWGLDARVLRAQAAAESGFRQSQVGDAGLSFGILQIKRTAWKGTFPLTRRSTTFNVDMHGAIMRECLDGRATWLRHGYRPGDLWGCVGYYFSGGWKTPEGEAYVGRVRSHLRAHRLHGIWTQR